MTHKQVYDLFINNYPQFILGTIEAWFSNGKNSIRLRMKGKPDYIFTYIGPNNWSFETVEHFAERLRGRTKM